MLHFLGTSTRMYLCNVMPDPVMVALCEHLNVSVWSTSMNLFVIVKYSTYLCSVVKHCTGMYLHSVVEEQMLVSGRANY